MRAIIVLCLTSTLAVTAAPILADRFFSASARHADHTLTTRTGTTVASADPEIVVHDEDAR